MPFLIMNLIEFWGSGDPTPAMFVQSEAHFHWDSSFLPKALLLARVIDGSFLSITEAI